MDKIMIYEWIKEQDFTKDSIIFEIGSHFGVDTEKIYELSNQANIHSFEPDPRNFKILQNRSIDKIAKLNNVAISDLIGKAEFHLSSGKAYLEDKLLADNPWSASSSLKAPKKHLERHPWVKFDDKVKVITLTLDYYCKVNNITTIDFIWCDVQGAEDLVLKGAKESLQKTKYFYTEFCNEELYEGELNLDQILKLLPNWEILFYEGENVLLKNNGI
jgi:2-O-methyltransferase